MELMIKKLAKESGLVIPKPKAKVEFKIKGMGMRRNEEALIYRIPSHSTKAQYYEKGVTINEFEKAHQRLVNTGFFTRTWFNENLKACAKEGGCNFTTIGGVFEILGIAEYSQKATYKYLT
ncbi:hypothetical protein [Aliivibrio sifiae]|uniref:Uncharacterized protein n=1 Tax=Aliivibrio sifiae TaxID=566293 RepID=A0A2S7X7R8_9GAMM|nr:hypothetical protein [Aliivibrio sifiae]PQJ87418.1 hypothetical protein BTO23_14980 [Aliivibrio sifiae]GLR77184.1 hypothetical protein GCM10007855_40590 [Aliivibrio sifiae]